MELDIRWQQRFANYVKALHKLTQAVEYIRAYTGIDVDSKVLDTTLDEIMKEGLIQRFEYTHELAWNVMKDYAAYQGNPDIGGSRDAVREAFQIGLIADGKVWMDMIASRNKTSHTYDEQTANEIYAAILQSYYPAFLAFRGTMEAKQSGNQTQLF